MKIRLVASSSGLCLGALVLALLAPARVAVAQVTVESANALPATSDLLGFSSINIVHHKSSDKSSDGSTLYAVRDADGLRLHFTVAVSQNGESAGRVVFSSIRSPEQLMPPGSHIGRKFGDEVWHSTDPRGGPDRSPYRLVTRMGTAVVVIDIYRKKTERVDGDPDWPLVDEADMKLAEDLTIGCLQRLVKMGIGTQAAATPFDVPPVSDVLRGVIAPVGVTPGFGGVRYRPGPNGNDEIEITRRRDGMRMVVHLSLSADIGDAMTLATAAAVSGQAGKMIAGSLTGRLFGNEVWHVVATQEEGGHGDVSLLTRMGRAMIRVDVVEENKRRASRNAGSRPVDDDQILAEEVTVGCLQRLLKKGIGSAHATVFLDPLPPGDGPEK